MGHPGPSRKPTGLSNDIRFDHNTSTHYANQFTKKSINFSTIEIKSSKFNKIVLLISGNITSLLQYYSSLAEIFYKERQYKNNDSKNNTNLSMNTGMVNASSLASLCKEIILSFSLSIMTNLPIILKSFPKNEGKIRNFLERKSY